MPQTSSFLLRMNTVAVPPILLVEDDPLLREAFRMLLEDAGYAVREAATARQALDAVAEETPGLILLDLGLPDRPGLDVAREIRSDTTTRHIPVIALTGSVGAAEQRACLDAGCASFLSKPVEPRDLLRRLPEWIAAHGADHPR